MHRGCAIAALPPLIDLDIQDRGYELLRIPLPRTPVNKGKESWKERLGKCYFGLSAFSPFLLHLDGSGDRGLLGQGEPYQGPCGGLNANLVALVSCQ